jgi:hypothetical protein
MSSNLSIKFIHADANGRGREPLEEVLAHGSKKLAFACAFMTNAGYKIITPYLHYVNKPGSFGVISIQQPTSYDALEDMFLKYPENTYVHLGTIFDYFEAGNYIGLMHSKLFLASDGKTTKVFCGSHNLTLNAQIGFNMEAATLIEGPSDDPFFRDVEAHLEDCKSKSSNHLPKRSNSQEPRLIIEIEVDDPKSFIENIKSKSFIKFLPKGTKDQPDLTPDSKFTILLFYKGTLKPDKPAPIAIAHINGTTTALNLGRKSPQQGVDASFSNIDFTITEYTEGIFEIHHGNEGAEDALSAVLKTTRLGTGDCIYLQRKPDTETEFNEIIRTFYINPENSPEANSKYQTTRAPEPKIDDDMMQFVKKRPSVIDTLLSKKRYWFSRWKRNL